MTALQSTIYNSFLFKTDQTTSQEDKYIPCKEAGLGFVKGDIIHIVSQVEFTLFPYLIFVIFLYTGRTFGFHILRPKMTKNIQEYLLETPKIAKYLTIIHYDQHKWVGDCIGCQLEVVYIWLKG